MRFQALHLALEAVPLWVQSDGVRLGTLEVGPVGVSHELGMSKCPMLKWVVYGGLLLL